LIVSAAAGSLYSIYDIIRGRGVVVESIAANSPFRALNVQPNDTIWRVAGKRVYSTNEIDDVVRSVPPNSAVTVSIISRGEHIERPGLERTSEMQAPGATAGVVGRERSTTKRLPNFCR
jgi:S1-C subfamily serine protease